MALFRLRLWPMGPNLLSAGLYELGKAPVLILWPLNFKSVAIPLGIARRS